ncbi:cation-translocating P-type ATPase [Chryseobacterium daecheongense]|uniref:cation-translocating P-type ATPase n=1 Tax=Chryseobacterium daecheongense TaxID=192389 RepID=UPI001FD6AEAD|nr:cation-translocating P-type ATPase [Chryseobacterium daecheongense]UOU97495.1 cation-translocating P-type ATPase [Chryseobacterium daecheongense]
MYDFKISGLTDQQVITARKEHGYNKLEYKKENTLLYFLKNIIKEPMIILLLVTSLLYFINNQINDGLFLAFAILLVSTISLYQESRSRNALEKLKTFTKPSCKVIRNGEVQQINTEEVVVGDSIMMEEGDLIIADGIIIHSNDFSVNQSILTGESLSVYKDKNAEDHYVYSGTIVASGLAVATVTDIGNKTKLGKIGKSLEDIKDEKSPLEIQINDFVKKMIIAGSVIFILVWIMNYLRSYNILDSLLKALTLAMSILPEEIPVAFATFMALGAWRLMRMGIIVKQMKTVETLGSATIICTDKTGTLTENEMTLAKLFLISSQKEFSPDDISREDEKELLELSMWASEPIPFDPMEKALHEAYGKHFQEDKRPYFRMIHEYPLDGKPPMMTHIFEDQSGNRIIAAKGAPEALIEVSKLNPDEKENIRIAVKNFASNGYRVLGVGVSQFSGNSFPEHQQEFVFEYKGLIAFYDPPKRNMQQVLNGFYQAGIAVKIITGDNSDTTMAIARQIGFKGYEKSITGEELMKLQDSELRECVQNINIFTRMFPEAKLRIIKALKTEKEIVAMTGDGVNDGPALKAAHIGIAMGKKGTEIAKQAASLILVDDDLEKMINAISMGRRIYSNLKKAIQYIISIHIPIILTVFLPLAFNWMYPNILTPLHVIFLELIMGPTCSIIYENEPTEENIMLQKPRPFATTFFKAKELMTSIIQGSCITIGVLFVYQFSVFHGYTENLTRTMVFSTLITANIFLTLINRSFYYSVFTTLKYKNNLIPLIILLTVIILGLIIYIKPLAGFFRFEALEFSQLAICCLTGFVSVIWYEIVKLLKRMSSK